MTTVETEHEGRSGQESECSDGTLEEKLSHLLAALRSNGSDNWVGKPPQVPLAELLQGLEDPPMSMLHSATVASGVPSSTAPNGLEELMKEYIADVKAVRKCAEQVSHETENTESSAPLDDRTFQSLLTALDELPEVTRGRPSDPEV